MGTQTRRTDFVDVQILTEAIGAVLPGLRVLAGSKVVTVKSGMPVDFAGRAVTGGTLITVPYFNAMGNKLDKVPENGALTPVVLSMTSDQATVARYGKAIEMTLWAELAAGWADPYAEFAKQFGEMTQNTVEDELILVAGTGLASAYVRDVSTASPNAPHTITYDDVIRSKILWGDEQAMIEMISVHSKVYQDMLLLKDSTGRPLMTDPNDGTLAKFNGIPVKVSDRNTIIGTGANAKYESLIFKTAALAWWYQSDPIVMVENDALAGSKVTAVHIFGAPYRYQRGPGSSKPGVVKLITN